MLDIKNLYISFKTPEGVVKAVNDVSFNIKKNQSLAIVGESGSGKTQLAFSILGLLDKNADVSGQINYQQNNLLNLSEPELNKIRSKKISIIFQDPMTSLNPYMKIKKQLNEILINHNGMTNEQATKESLRILDAVKIQDPVKTINSYPHELSGGMRQRVMIGMSILCKPEIIIADEPTTSLDVTVQSQIMALFNEIKREFNSSIILITHNMGIVKDTCDKLMVMYGGKIMELGKTNKIFDNPLHPYTKGLLETVPKLNENYKKLKTIKGNPINMIDPPTGCIFRTRCPNPTHDCNNGKTTNFLIEKETNHWVDQCCVNCN